MKYAPYFRFQSDLIVHLLLSYISNYINSKVFEVILLTLDFKDL